MSPLSTSFAKIASHVAKADDINTRMTAEVEAVRLSSYSTQPTWCNFAGVTCGSTVGTVSYASITSIDLTRFSLRGQIPRSIGTFKSMTSLDLSRNLLSGTIPSSLGKLISLNSLDLSNNVLIGMIPHTFVELQTISELNLSNNKLSGTVTEIQYYAVQVPPSTVSSTTLTSKLSNWDYDCFHWLSPLWSSQVYIPTNSRDTGMHSIQYVHKCVTQCYLKYRHLSFLVNEETHPLSSRHYVMYSYDEDRFNCCLQFHASYESLSQTV